MKAAIFFHKSTGQPVQIIARAQTKPTFQEVICYQELTDPYDYYVMERRQFFSEYVREFEDLPLVGHKQIGKRDELPNKQPRISKGEVTPPEEAAAMSDKAATAATAAKAADAADAATAAKAAGAVDADTTVKAADEETSDPRMEKLLAFFDAETCKEKMKLLEKMKDELDDFMLNNIAVSMDLSIEDGADGYEFIMSELRIRSRYESRRGDRF